MTRDGDPVIDDIVIETLREAQRFGLFGKRPIEEAVEHSMSFVHALDELVDGARIVDMGSGGGLPGFVLAASCPTASVTLIDRREKRADFLRRAVGRIGWDHVEVVSGDVEAVARAVADGGRPAFDAVTARGFGPPTSTVTMAARLVRAGGLIVISEPPDADRWDAARLEALGLDRVRAGAVSVFRTRV
jgi:16S rRNA (guanine527-N7)-methyltransferase